MCCTGRRSGWFFSVQGNDPETQSIFQRSSFSVACCVNPSPENLFLLIFGQIGILFQKDAERRVFFLAWTSKDMREREETSLEHREGEGMEEMLLGCDWEPQLSAIRKRFFRWQIGWKVADDAWNGTWQQGNKKYYLVLRHERKRLR